MKKPLIVFAFFLVLVGCYPADEQESNNPEVATIEEGGIEEVSNGRTIDLMGEDPFEIGVNKVIIGKWVDDGETVYVLEDGKILEEKMLNAIPEHKQWLKEEYGGEFNIKITDRISFDDNLEAFSKNILRDHPDKEAYIDKLREANEALKQEDEEKVQKLIDEARKLREQ